LQGDDLYISSLAAFFYPLISVPLSHGLFIVDAPMPTVGVNVDELKVIGPDNQVLQRLKIKPRG
jgi:hypothetical protein